VKQLRENQIAASGNATTWLQTPSYHNTDNIIFIYSMLLHAFHITLLNTPYNSKNLLFSAYNTRRKT
jgi:hypothetical protein